MNYNYNTKNQSFLEMSRFLQMSGVKNYNFMLAQENLDLPDPYSIGLSEDEKEAIVKESQNNMWYFFREVLRIPSTTASSGIGCTEQFGLNLCNMNMLYLMDLGANLYVLGSRQYSHKTQSMVAYLIWYHKNIRAFHRDVFDKDSIFLDQRASTMISLLPGYIKNSMGSVLINQTRKDIYWFDNAEFLEDTYIQELNNLINTSNDQFILTSTVNNKENNVILEDIRCNANVFNNIIYDMDYDKVIKHFVNIPQNPKPFILLNFNANMLGVSEIAKHNMLRDLNNDQDAYDSEIMLIRKGEK